MFGRVRSSAPSRWGSKTSWPPRPNRALVQDSRLWPTLPSWWSGLCVGWCGVISSGRDPALSPLNPSFIPIHTVSHMLLGWAQTHRNARQSWGPRPPYQSHPTLAHAPHHTRTRRLLAATSSYTHIYHAPSVTVAKSRVHVHVCPASSQAAQPSPTPLAASSSEPAPLARTSKHHRKWACPPAATASVKCSSYRGSDGVLKSGGETARHNSFPRLVITVLCPL